MHKTAIVKASFNKSKPAKMVVDKEFSLLTFELERQGLTQGQFNKCHCRHQ